MTPEERKAAPVPSLEARLGAWRIPFEPRRIVCMTEEPTEILYRLGVESVTALRGRTDLLCHLDYEVTDAK